MSSSWSIYIIIGVIIQIIAYAWLLLATSKTEVEGADHENDTGHVWDEDLRELNNPLPKWWLNLFILTIVFGFLYLALYPGLGNVKGLLGWTQEKQFKEEYAVVREARQEYFSQFKGKSIPELAKDPEALKIGGNIFANRCAVCHGSDAQGAIGFPNLTDEEWLYGGEPEDIKTSITNGRHGVMPPFAQVLGEEGIQQVATFVRATWHGKPGDPALVEAGKQKFQNFCAACHGVDGKGNKVIGAPDLTNEIWLHGTSDVIIETVLHEGASGTMPAHKGVLEPEAIKVVAAYVYSLSHKQ